MFTKAEVEIFTRVFSRILPEGANSILKLSHTSEERERLEVLSAKAGKGTGTKADDGEREAYGAVGSLLSILQSKARQSQKNSV